MWVTEAVIFLHVLLSNDSLTAFDNVQQHQSVMSSDELLAGHSRG